MNREIATELNNLGVCFLDVGDLRKSLNLFRDALTYTMGELQINSPFDLASYREALAAYASIATQSSRQSLKNHTHERLQHQQEQQQDTEFAIVMKTAPITTSAPFIHSHGINLISSPVAYSPDTLVNTTVVASVIIFNLAVVHHLKGLEGGQCGDGVLLKAMSLYQKGFMLLSDAGVSSFATGNPVVDVLSMALFNNMAHICYELSQYSESRRYFNKLVGYARTVTPQLYGDSFVGAVLEQQKSSYLLNAIILQSPKLAPAA